MIKAGQKPFLKLTAIAAAMLLSLAGCGNTNNSVTDAASGTGAADITQEESAETPVSISAGDYAAMGMTAYDTASELEEAAGFGILSLEKASDAGESFKDYSAEEIVLDNGAAKIRYAAGGEPRRVIIMNAAPEGTLDTSGRTALADISVGERLITISEDKEQSLKQAWWTEDGCTYTVDAFNVEDDEFKTLLETLCG